MRTREDNRLAQRLAEVRANDAAHKAMMAAAAKAAGRKYIPQADPRDGDAALRNMFREARANGWTPEPWMKGAAE